MKVWTASAVIRYYLNPSISFLGARGSNGQKTGAGYYIIPHCDPACCQDFEHLTQMNLGPFKTSGKARAWSRKYMAAPS